MSDQPERDSLFGNAYMQQSKAEVPVKRVLLERLASDLHSAVTQIEQLAAAFKPHAYPRDVRLADATRLVEQLRQMLAELAAVAQSRT